MWPVRNKTIIGLKSDPTISKVPSSGMLEIRL